MLWRRVTRVINLRDFLLCLIIVAALFAIAPTRAQDAAPKETGKPGAAADPEGEKAKDLIKRIKDILKELQGGAVETPEEKKTKELVKKAKDIASGLTPKKAATPPDPVPKEPELAALATTISRVLSPDKALDSWGKTLLSLLRNGKANYGNEELQRTVIALTKALKPTKSAPASDLRKQVIDLRDELEKRRKDEGVVPPEAEADLATLAEIISQKIDPTLAVTRWATDLNFIVVERNPDREAAEALLDNVAKALPPADLELGPYLNIVQAWFGDFHYVRRAVSGQLRIDASTGAGRRVCDATLEVRSACQGRLACPFSEEKNNTTTFKPNIGKLCGEHPVPLGSGEIVGLAVEYQCLTVPRATWDRLERNWKIEQVPKVPGDDEPLSKMVLIRETNFNDVKIRCQAELPEAGR